MPSIEDELSQMLTIGPGAGDSNETSGAKAGAGHNKNKKDNSKPNGDGERDKDKDRPSREPRARSRKIRYGGHSPSGEADPNKNSDAKSLRSRKSSSSSRSKSKSKKEAGKSGETPERGSSKNREGSALPSASKPRRTKPSEGGVNQELLGQSNHSSRSRSRRSKADEASRESSDRGSNHEAAAASGSRQKRSKAEGEATEAQAPESQAESGRQQTPPRSPKSPKGDRRKIRYRKEAGEGGATRERTRDEKSVRSRQSRATRGHTHRSKSDDLLATRRNQASEATDETGRTGVRSSSLRSKTKKISYQRDGPESARERDRDARSLRSARSRTHRRAREGSIEESHDEEDPDLLDEATRPRSSRRRAPTISQSAHTRPTERRTRRVNISMSMHEASPPPGTGLGQRGIGLTGSTASRRPPRRTAGEGQQPGSIGMVLGDPSRRAPPARSRSNESGENRKPPSRSHSNDFADFLRKTGLDYKPSRRVVTRMDGSTNNNNKNSFESDEEDGDEDNPFEVTYISKSILTSRSQSDASDPFDPFEGSSGDELELSGKSSRPSSSSNREPQRKPVAPTKSGGLLAASTKDTLSRPRAPKKATGEEKHPSAGGHSEADAKTERAKQRRNEYKKSLAAAAMAGKQQPSQEPLSLPGKRSAGGRQGR